MSQTWRLISSPGTASKASVAKIIVDNTLVLTQLASGNTYIIKSKTLKIASTGLSEGFFVNLKNANLVNLTVCLLTSLESDMNQTINMTPSQHIILYFDGTSLTTY